MFHLAYRIAATPPGRILRTFIDKRLNSHPKIVKINNKIRLYYNSISDLDCARKAVTRGMDFEESWIFDNGHIFDLLDLGGNSGLFPIYIFNKTNILPNGICVEASFKMINKIKCNFLLNNIPMKVIHGMVGEKPGTLFHINESSMASGSIKQTWALTRYNKVEQPPIVNIAKIWNKEGDFLKVDIEGSEYGLFKNTPNKFFKLFRKILVEWHEPLCYLSTIRDALNKTHKLTNVHYINQGSPLGYAYFDRI